MSSCSRHGETDKEKSTTWRNSAVSTRNKTSHAELIPSTAEVIADWLEGALRNKETCKRGLASARPLTSHNHSCSRDVKTEPVSIIQSLYCPNWEICLAARLNRHRPTTRCIHGKKYIRVQDNSALGKMVPHFERLDIYSLALHLSCFLIAAHRDTHVHTQILLVWHVLQVYRNQFTTAGSQWTQGECSALLACAAVINNRCYGLALGLTDLTVLQCTGGCFAEKEPQLCNKAGTHQHHTPLHDVR